MWQRINSQNSVLLWFLYCLYHTDLFTLWQPGGLTYSFLLMLKISRVVEVYIVGCISMTRLATGWTVRGSNTGGGEIFRTCPDRPWDPPSLLYNGYRVFPGGKERPGRDADPSPLSSAVGHERVELYLYSPYRPYGLCRASVPVQGCTLHL